MRFFAVIFSLSIGLMPLTGQAAEKTFLQRFVEAAGIADRPVIQNGNGFAAGQTVPGPYGGSYTIDAGQWSGNSGTIYVTYNNFGLPNGWKYNGNWTYTGSVLANNMLEGTLVGQWTITGLSLGAGLSDLSFGMNVRFTGGKANLTMTYSLNYGGYPVQQTLTYSFDQADMLAFLL